MARVLFTTMGTWGDLFPMIGVGIDLAGRGHGVRFAAPPVWRAAVEWAGLDFTPLGGTETFAEFVDHPEVLAPIPWGLRKAMRWFLFDQIDLLTDQLTAAVSGADLVVTHPAHIAAHDVAEQLGVPRVVATVFPMMIPSAYTVPGGSPLGPWPGRLGQAANRGAWRFGHLGSTVFFDRPINRHRRSLGLAPVRAGIIRLSLAAAATVVMADPAFIHPPPDWPATVTVTSFVGWDLAGPATIPPDVERFLGAGAPPVLVTLGASGAIDPEDFLPRAAREISDLGFRVLVVTGPARLADTEWPDGVLVAEYVPFSLVGRRCRAAVHHGGVGTTAAFVRAGIPQVAVPKGFDQPLTAARVEALGIGRSVPWRKRYAQLGPAVSSVVADTGMSRRARELSGRLGPDGARASAEVIEAVLAGKART